MPNKVVDNTRWKILQALTSYLKQIQRSGGYNTQPLVVTDQRMDRKKMEDAEVVLVLVDGGESLEEAGIGKQLQWNMEVVVAGRIYGGTFDPMEQRSALLQDLRHAIMSNACNLSDDAGTTVVLDIGGCETDQGEVTDDDGYSWFAQSFNLTYFQDEDW